MDRPTVSRAAHWFCEAHRVWTSSDCPKCDVEQIADLERYAKTPACHWCHRTLAAGESVWASDWTVIEPNGARIETRYTCDACDAAAHLDPWMTDLPTERSSGANYDGQGDA